MTNIGKEKIRDRAKMISHKVLSEVEKVCCKKKINKKDLAGMVGTSRSYITQLFNGTKNVNTYIMAKFEIALNMKFEITITEYKYGSIIDSILTPELRSVIDNDDVIQKIPLNTPEWDKRMEELRILNNLEYYDTDSPKWVKDHKWSKPYLVSADEFRRRHEEDYYQKT